MLWAMFRAEKTMFRPPGDDSLAARMPRIKRVWLSHLSLASLLLVVDVESESEAVSSTILVSVFA